ncbi:peptidoglycan DD-metalloendopeptidase family protein [Metabacillus fastidiosus]|uniref:peptidoglycan DD-metalloendopeptidase family protein n=1 Tax=Metabacillus fastidiosus TaxID=1458 RepID=UPI003D29C212
MVNLFDKNTPAPQLLEDVMRKINALGHEPRVIIELDKVSYVPGVKSKFEVWDRIRSATINHQASNSELESPLTEEPTDVSGDGESSDRFEYIKCAFDRWVKEYNLPKDAYYFFLAVCKHETVFGTQGKGVASKGSHIVGYGCPGSCDPTYSGIDTQAKYAAKRFAEAMKSRLNKIKTSGMNANDVDYFHQGGDKGYNKWVWSADGANWKARVKQYYDSIKGQAMLMNSKWECNQGSGPVHANITPLQNVSKDCGCEENRIKDSELSKNMNFNTSSSSGNGLRTATFPIEGIDFASGAVVSSHHMKHKGGRAGHKGIDIVHSTKGKINGMWVVAAWPGYVHKSYKSPTYGNCVMIQHSNGYMTVYAHMQDSSIQVRTGQLVNPGTRLGKVGNTGNSYGAHLHFEIWKGSWVYGGTNHLDPYWALVGHQKLSIAPMANVGSETGGEVQDTPKMSITENIKFNKCFDKDGKLDANWVSKENAKHFTSLKTGEKYLGFSDNVKKGEVKDFGYKHNFSADGFYEYAYFADLQEGDSVTVTYDGTIVARYTKSDNTKQPTYESPIYALFAGSELEGANSHILDFTINNISGKAVFGLKCFKVTEVETQYGSQFVDERLTARKRDVWLDTGGFVYDTTFTIDDDVLDWEVNTHFDMRVATAKFRLDNRHGIYSPSYRRDVIFPENMREAEMSYYEEGAIRHVLSEATPVRIYVGYGENVVRVFTGKIKGEIEEDSEQRTITINCVDMYDELEEHVFDRIMTYPVRDEVHGDEPQPLTMWVKSAIVHNIVNESGMIDWRIHQDDLMYPDAIIEETYYIDIDKGGKEAVVWDVKKKQYVKKKIATVKDAYGYKNPFVQAIDFMEGTRASDAIQELIGDIMYRAYCDRYGTFRLENIRNISAGDNAKWEFTDGENLQSLTTAIDHSRIRNHLMVVGSGGQLEHFVDRDLLISTKGKMRTAKIVAEWIDESYGSNARGTKEDVAAKLFFDMKRQARTFSVVVKGNPMIEVLDGAYVYDQHTSSAGYYVIKGNRLIGNKEGMVNLLELTWEELNMQRDMIVRDSYAATTSIEVGSGQNIDNSNDSTGGDTGTDDARKAVVDLAKSYIGKLKYVWGGKKISSGGGDCSGFSHHIFNKAANYNLGHGTMTQITKGKKIATSDAKAGDVVFFKGTISSRGKNTVSHVGIVTKPGYCISLASSGCKEHGYLTSNDSYWGKHFMQINRVLP